MNILIKKTFCYESIAESFIKIFDKVAIWDDAFSLRSCLGEEEDYIFWGVYEECRPSTIRFLAENGIRSVFCSAKDYGDEKNFIYLDMLGLSEGKIPKMFWPYHNFENIYFDKDYSSEIAIVYDLDYSKISGKVLPMLQSDVDIATWGSFAWPWACNRGAYSELALNKIVTNSKSVLLTEGCDVRYAVKTFSYGSNPTIIKNNLEEVTPNKEEYSRFDSKMFSDMFKEEISCWQ